MHTLFKPIRWQSLPRDFVIIQIGFALFGLALALIIQANLGTNPWTMLAVALSDLSGLTKGTLVVIIGVFVLGAALLMREPVGWGTVGNILFIGPWLDVWLRFIPPLANRWLPQTAMLLTGILLLGLATGIYISVNAGAGPRDSLMLAVMHRTSLNLRQGRGMIEFVVFIVAWALGGPFGVGTVLIAILIGPAVQFGFRLFKVETSR